MTHRRVAEVMTVDVACVGEATPFKELAELMTERQVSALPVLDAGGRVSGVVSEADLLPKEEAQEDPGAPPLPWRQRHRERVKATGDTAAAVMSSPAVTIGAGASVVEAARVLDRHQVKRLPVVDARGRLVGIVSRRDLLKVFLRSDEQIAREVFHEAVGDWLGTNPALVKVTVAEGVVTLSGEVEKKSMVAPVIRIARSVDGVVDVVDRLGYAIDDTAAAQVEPHDPGTGLYLGPGGLTRHSS